MTSENKTEIQKTINECKQLLQLPKNCEWIERYSKYADGIINNEDLIKSARNLFHQVKPLYLYSKISKAYSPGNIIEYDLRFYGQSVATIKIKNDEVRITTKDKDETNKKYFTISTGCCPNQLNDDLWTSEQAREFKVFFRKYEKELSEHVKSPEHKIESNLLNIFNDIKYSRNIKPVEFANAYFQMPTPFKGSEKGIVYYSDSYGGGIDILVRITHGNNKDNRFAVMELKDENKSSEPQKYVLLQAVKYATFLAYLFRSKSGFKWYKILNPKTKAKVVPKNLKIDVVSVMPKGDSDILHRDEIFLIEENVQLHLYSLFFDTTESYNFSGTFADIIRL